MSISDGRKLYAASSTHRQRWRQSSPLSASLAVAVASRSVSLRLRLLRPTLRPVPLRDVPRVRWNRVERARGCTTTSATRASAAEASSAVPHSSAAFASTSADAFTASKVVPARLTRCWHLHHHWLSELVSGPVQAQPLHALCVPSMHFLRRPADAIVASATSAFTAAATSAATTTSDIYSRLTPRKRRHVSH